MFKGNLIFIPFQTAENHLHESAVGSHAWNLINMGWQVDKAEEQAFFHLPYLKIKL